MEGVYKFSGNMGEYATCIIGLGGWTFLLQLNDRKDHTAQRCYYFC